MNTQASSGSSLHLTPKTHSESCLQGARPLTRYGKHREQLCSPVGPGHMHTGPFRRMKGGKDTHWSSVFNFFLHLPLARPSLSPSHFPSIHTYAFESTSPPGVAYDFTPPAFLPVFLVCSVISQAQKLCQVEPTSSVYQ